jgi:hypothetical protein
MKGSKFTDDYVPSIDTAVCRNEVYMSGLKHLKVAKPVLLIQKVKMPIYSHKQTNHEQYSSTNS